MRMRVGNSRQVYFMIYLSHTLSAWGDRMWDFAVGLYMVILYPDSLLLTALLGFAIALSIIVFGSPLGTWIDKSRRIVAATLAIAIQNTAVVCGATTLALTFAFKEDVQLAWNGSLQICVYAFVIFVSIIAKLASIASDIAIERDWIVILTNGDESRLATMNSVMRSIDLTTNIIAPAAIGALLSYWSQITTALFIAVWNIASGIAEVALLMLIYKRVPQLDSKEFLKRGDHNNTERRNALQQWWDGWRQYIRHPVRWAGLGFSCLFMTVLGFDQITAGYMYSQGVGESFIGIVTALGAILGIIGSVSYPLLRKYAGKHKTALLGYVLNSVCLVFCVISIFMTDSPFDPKAILNLFRSNTSIITDNDTTANEEHLGLTITELWEKHKNVFYFVAGVILARFGLWVADLSTAQIFQDSVEESKRGVMNGVQNSMNQAMDLLKFLLVILLPSPQTFGYLIILTWIFGLIGGLLYYVYSSVTPTQSKSQPVKLHDECSDRPSASLSDSVNEDTPLLLKSNNNN